MGHDFKRRKDPKLSKCGNRDICYIYPDLSIPAIELAYKFIAEVRATVFWVAKLSSAVTLHYFWSFRREF